MNVWKLFAGFMLVSYLTMTHASESPVGNWITFDDKTGEKRAVITISESTGIVSGIIKKTYPQPGDTGICTACPGAFKDKKIPGLGFMWGLKSEGNNEWGGGFILDAKSGKIYRARIKLQGDQLFVRGYIGFSLLGRSQTWLRES